MKRITEEDLKFAKPLKPKYFWLKKFILMNLYSLLLSTIALILVYFFNVGLNTYLTSTSEFSVAKFMFVFAYIFSFITQLLLDSNITYSIGFLTRLCGLKKYSIDLYNYNKLEDEFEKQEEFIELSEKYKDLK